MIKQQVPAASASPFTLSILQWYHANGRHLPWRETHDPYAIWLSEVILQQTRIQQGEAYWRRFVTEWPTVKSLAAATEDEILRLWQGLGYYSRARNLHAAARQIAEQGAFPSEYEDIRKLKGVGDYTAAAIASFAFNKDVAAVDGNVYRVLSRYFGLDTPIDTTKGKKTITLLANELLPKGHSADFNQGLMDFGSLQCTPKNPHCEACLLQVTCMAYRSGTVANLPVKSKKMAIKERRMQYVFLRCEGKTAIRRRPSGDIWPGLWEPPLFEDTTLPDWEGSWTLLAQGVKHVLTHRILWIDFYILNTKTPPALSSDFIWITEADYGNYGKPQVIAKIIDNYFSSNTLASPPSAVSL